MSRRFGRNQKRKMREQIEFACKEAKRWEIENRMSGSLLRAALDSESNHKEVLARIVQTINDECPNSALLPPSVVVSGIDLDYRGKIMLHLAPKMSLPDFTKEPSTEKYESVRTIGVRELCATIERQRDKLGTLVHLYMRGDEVEHSAAYMCSDEAIRCMSNERKMRVTRAIARDLYRYFDHTYHKDVKVQL